MTAGDAAFNGGNFSTAMRLLLPLAQHGDPLAQLDVGLMYYLGEGVAEDQAEAVRWFSRSAKQGDDAAQVNLGVAFATGTGVRLDKVQAYVWFSLAAKSGRLDAAKTYRDGIAADMSDEQLTFARRTLERCEALGQATCD